MLLHNHPEYVSCACGYHAVNYDAKSLTITIFLLPPPSLSFAARLHPPLVHYGLVPLSYLSKMAESALAARAKIRPPCTLKHGV